MQFIHPVILYSVLGVLLPLMIVVALWSRWQRQQDLQAFGSRELVEQLTGHLSSPRRIIRSLALMAGLFLMGIALSGPQYGMKMVEVHRQGVDVIIALDVSRSMMAEDVRPNRLQRAQQELSALIDHLQGDRVGVIAFAGSAQVACPLTTDYPAAKMFLNYLAPEFVPVPGTALSAAIHMALETFPSGGEGYRVLVLLTDGEDHDSHVLEAAREAKAAGVKILSIGFGTPAGEPIPVRDSQGKIKSYVKDVSGKTVVSRLDEAILKKITEVTGGMYLPAHHGSLEAKQIADLINQMRKRDVSAGQYGAFADRYQFALLPALILLLLAFWLPERRGSWLFMVLVLVLIPQISLAGTAEDVNKGNRAYKKGKYEESLQAYRDAQIKRPDEPVVDYNLGNALHQLKKYDEAEKAYQRALKSKDKALRARTLYNLGNTYFQSHKYGEAVRHYREALKLKPRDEDTIYNLAQAIMLMKNPPPDKQKQKEKHRTGQKRKEKSGKGQRVADEQGQEKAKGKKEQAKGQQKKLDEKAKLTGPDDRGEAQSEERKEQETPPGQLQDAPRPGEMQPEEAENILNAVREAEKEAQRKRMKKMQQQPSRRGRPDW